MTNKCHNNRKFISMPGTYASERQLLVSCEYSGNIYLRVRVENFCVALMWPGKFARESCMSECNITCELYRTYVCKSANFDPFLEL